VSEPELYTGAVADVLDALGLVHQTLPPDIGALRAEMRLEGTVYAVEGRTRPNHGYEKSIRKILRMLGDVPSGHVPVYATGDDACAQFGELSATALAAKGCPGVVTDGGTRDVAFIEAMGFPVFCRYTTPIDSVPRWEAVAWGHEVEIGGVRVATGDWVLGDADGVVLVPAARRDEVLARAREIVGTENRVREAVRGGLTPLEAYERFGKF
jgi:4-hydroxy-4-methyl-2-oxoglutarate aldolase